MNFVGRGIIAGIGFWTAMVISGLTLELDHPHTEHPIKLLILMIIGVGLCILSCILVGVGTHD